LTRWLEDYGSRYAEILDVVRAAVDHGRLDVAREGLAAIDKVPGSGSLWRARALLEIDRGERAAGLEPDPPTWKQALAEAESGHPENMGELIDKVDLLAELAGRLSREEAGKLLARAAELAKGAETVADSCGRALTSSAMLTRLARAHAELGHEQDALALLARVVGLAETLPIPPPTKGSSVDFPAAAQKDRVEVFARAAAGFELAGDTDRATAALAKAVGEIDTIANQDWRRYAWRAIVETYAATGKLERALDIVGSARNGTVDTLYALDELAERLPAADFLRLEPLVSALPACFAKVSYLVQLAARYEKDGDPAAAARMMDQALEAIAAKPDGWDQALLALAVADPHAARPAGPERQKLLRAILNGL
jgi:tetratricopeptide (TPR) repeat protein